MLKNLKYNALLKHFEAERDRCLYQLNLSFENPVAVGEHPTLLEDDKKLIGELAHAEECIDSLEINFNRVNKEEAETLDTSWVGEDK
jgi:hypothetical protein|tara:strand:- start:920 stop:1180 length:261 start_codon:yes stop_codon:yes gene_type:complete